jgi:hypothetical protein
MPERLLTVREVSELMAVPVATLNGWRSRGTPAGVDLPVVTFGRSVRYRLTDVLACIDANTKDTAHRAQFARRRRRVS